MLASSAAMLLLLLATFMLPHQNGVSIPIPKFPLFPIYFPLFLYVPVNSQFLESLRKPARNFPSLCSFDLNLGIKAHLMFMRNICKINAFVRIWRIVKPLLQVFVLMMWIPDWRKKGGTRGEQQPVRVPPPKTHWAPAWTGTKIILQRSRVSFVPYA